MHLSSKSVLCYQIDISTLKWKNSLNNDWIMLFSFLTCIEFLMYGVDLRATYVIQKDLTFLIIIYYLNYSHSQAYL